MVNDKLTVPDVLFICADGSKVEASLPTEAMIEQGFNAITKYPSLANIALFLDMLREAEGEDVISTETLLDYIALLSGQLKKA